MNADDAVRTALALKAIETNIVAIYRRHGDATIPMRVVRVSQSSEGRTLVLCDADSDGRTE